jgi:hypothetical protein
MRLLASLMLLLALAGCSIARGSKLWAPEHFGLERVAPQLYVERGTDAATRERLRAAMDRAREAVRAAYGEVSTQPIVHACVSEGCYAGFGGMGSTAKVYGDRILLSPRGLDWHSIAHEWSHAELHSRLGLSAWMRVPQWFDEGLAVAVSDGPETSEAHWQFLERAGVRRPTPEELRQVRSRREWVAAAQRFGDADNQQRKAQGQQVLRPLYTAAGHELRPWLRTRGPQGLRAFIKAVRAGADFDGAYGVVPP